MVIVWGPGLSYVSSTLVVVPGGGGAGGAIPTTATARGNVDFDQIRVAARTGNGVQFLVWNQPGPGASTSTGTTGQIAYDSSGNFYWCYAANSWARIGPAGYSNSF